MASTLTRFNFYQWGHLKTLVYAVPVDNEEALHHRNGDACQTLHNYPAILERMRRSVMRRVEACTESHGGHFNTYYKCTLSAIQIKCFRTDDVNFFSFSVWNSCPKFINIFQSYFVHFLHLAPSTGIKLASVQTHVHGSGQDTFMYQDYFHHQSILNRKNIAPQSYSFS
jgi:hypothetical protein